MEAEDRGSYTGMHRPSQRSSENHPEKQSRLSGRGSGLHYESTSHSHKSEYVAIPSAGELANQELDSHPKTWMQKLMEHPSISHISAFVILANGVVIGLETDFPSAADWSSIETTFLVMFTVELGAKLFAQGYLFFSYYREDFSWNIFDFIIVTLGLIDFVTSHIAGFGAGGFATIFRLIRLARILRLVRLFQFLKSLYLLAVGLVEACKAVVWVTILMSFVLYITAITMVRTVGRVPHSDKHYEFLHEYFGNIPAAMISLFISMSSPNLYTYQAEEGLLEDRPGLCAFLIMFITLGSFGLIATLTGVITDRVFANNAMLQDEKRQEHELERKRLGNRMMRLFDELDTDGDGLVPIQKLKEIAPDVLQLIEECGAKIDHGDVIAFIEQMDSECTGAVDFEQFSTAMVTYAQGVTPLAIMMLLHRVGKCLTSVKQVDDRILKIDERVLAVIEQQATTLELIRDQQKNTSRMVEEIRAILANPPATSA